MGADQPPEAYAACGAQAGPDRARIERMRDGYAKAAAMRDWSRRLDGCHEQVSEAHDRAKETAYLGIIRETGY